MTRFGLVGATGRMGQALASVIAQTPGAHLVDPADCDCLIDFSAPDALAQTLASGKPAVIGTTGLGPQHHAAIDAASRHTPLLYGANMSLGVTLLLALAQQAAARLGTDWDVEILEMHHRHKVDAPSGTALALGEAVAQGRGVALADVAVTSREGVTGPRRAGDIGFATLRGGSVPGDHRVIFAGEDEQLTLSHQAGSRSIFARGAVRAALWLVTQPPGRYGMADVLGL